MKRTLLCLAVMALMAPLALKAQVTGILAGKVVDGDGKPIVGAAVKLLSSEYFTRSKDGGKFQIVGVRAGDYTMKVSNIGYQDVTRPVSVSANQTTEIKVTLSSTEVRLKEITVTAKRDEKKSEQVGSVRTVKGAELQEGTRSANLIGAISLNASAQTAGVNGVSIRGGRSNDTKFLVDGVNISDRFTGGTGAASSLYPTVSSLAIQEIQVVASGFGPEYGDVLSGVVNSVTRVGRTDRYEGAFKFRTQVPALYGSSSPVTFKKLGSNEDTTLPGAKLQGSGRKNYDFAFGGPIPGTDKVTFFLSGNLQDVPISASGYEVYDMSPEYAKARESIAKQVWGYALQPQNLGQIPHSHTMVRNLSSKFKFLISNELSIELGGEIGRTSREIGDWGNLYMADHPVFYRTENGQTIADTNKSILERDAMQINQNQNINRISTRLFYYLDEGSFLDVNASYVNGRTETGKKDESKSYSIFNSYDIYPITDSDGDKIIDRYYSPQVEVKLNNLLDPTVGTVSAPGRNTITGLYEEGETAGASNNPYGLTGGTFPAHGNDRSLELREYTALTLKTGYENNFSIGQVQTQLKAGFEFNQTTLRRHQNSLAWDANPFFDIYGYSSTYFSGDATGKLSAFFEKPYKPIDGAVYAGTRFTYKSIIFSPGLRFDFYAPGIQVAPTQRNTIEDVVKALDTTKTASVKFQISPRVGVSYPITETSNFRVSFAMMFKRPDYNLLYDNVYNDASRGNQIFGNPDIEPEKTVMYEMGYSAGFADIYSIDVSAYYRDIFNQAGISYVPVLPSPYSLYSTQEFGNVRGLEVSLRRELSDNIRAEINYTLQQARGTASNPTANYSLVVTGGRDEFTGDKQQFPLTEFPLDYDQSHRLNGTLSVIWGKDEGPALGGLKLLENTIITLTATYETGLPYTREDSKGKPITEYNSLRLPSSFGTEAHLERSFYLADWFGESVGKMELGFFADISNLLNTTDAASIVLSRAVGGSRFTIAASPNYSGQEAKIGDFTATPYFRQIDPNHADTWSVDQYDRFGTRLYNPYADINLDGVVTQLEKYESYKRFLTTSQMQRGAYQTPRTVAVGVRLKF